MNPRIFLSPPWMGGSEKSNVEEAFAGNYIAPCGPFVDRFEADFARAVGRKHAVALSSCSAALELLFDRFGIASGDTVVCPSLTFIASIAGAVRRGARPLFLDVSPETWTLNPELLEATLARTNVKLVIAVDLYGQCADYDALAAICARYGVPLLIDAAESLGALYKGRPAGNLTGAFAVYSFNGNKIITTSGGGMLVTDDAEAAARFRKLATQAREETLWYEHRELGYNYRLSNISAAIGVGQLAILPEAVRRKQDIFKRYQAAFPGVPFMPEAPYGVSTKWLTVACFGKARAARIQTALEAENIESRPVWKPLHLQPVFAGNTAECPVSEELFASGLCLPSGCGLTESQQDRVIQVIRTVLGE